MDESNGLEDLSHVLLSRLKVLKSLLKQKLIIFQQRGHFVPRATLNEIFTKPDNSLDKKSRL
jgi:hypothetical protein